MSSIILPKKRRKAPAFRHGDIRRKLNPSQKTLDYPMNYFMACSLPVKKGLTYPIESYIDEP
jgi:hypothetical protein